MDRVDPIGPGRALVIDYKYSADAKKYQERHERGDAVQAGIYLRAVPKVGDYEPAGMLYVSLRGGVQFSGWVAEASQFNTACTPESLREQMNNAAGTALRVIQEIRTGNIAPHPATPANCKYCEARDACRFEVAVAAEGAGEVE